MIDGLKWDQSESQDSVVGLVANAAATTGGGSRSADFSPTPFTTSNQQGHNLVAALDCYSVAMTRSVPMRLAALLSLMLLAPTTLFGHEAKVTAEGMSEEFATAEAIRVIPKGASVNDTSCRSKDIGMSTLYWCTVTYSD